MIRSKRPTIAALLALSSLVVAAPTVAAQEDPVITDHTVESFDGTLLATTLFVPAGVSDDAPAPLVLRTHGWGGSRETELGGTLAKLVDDGYAVLTWDSRGFGCSGGEVRIDDPEFEGRDASALIDWAIDNAPIATDATGDPIVGMAGGSYAGGIQMATNVVDDRLDALAPEIAWSDLRYSLYGGEVVKQGWVSLLYGLGTATGTALGLDPSCDGEPTADAVDPALHKGVTEFLTTGRVSASTLDFFAGSSLAGFGADHPVQVPTLVLQGSVDTLFDLTDGYDIYDHVRAQGADARFVAFCGGHVACPDSYADADDRAYLDDAILTWFAKHLRGEDVDTGSPISYRTNDGEWRDTDLFTPVTTLPVSGAGESLPVVPVVDVPDVEEVLALIAAGPPSGIPGLPITAAKPALPGDPRAVTFEVAQADGGPMEVLGIPSIELTVSGTTVPLADALEPLGELVTTLPREQVGDALVGSAGPLGTIAGGVVYGIGGDGEALSGVDGTVNLFVKLIHREAEEVLNLQEGAVRVDITDGEVTVDVPMPGLAYTLPEGDHLDLEVATASLLHATGRTPAIVDVGVAGEVPVLGAAAPGRPDSPGRSDEAPKGPPQDRPGRGPDATVLPAAGGGQLPATGGGIALFGLLALAGASALRRLAAPAVTDRSGAARG